MKLISTIFYLLLVQHCLAQHLPVSAYTYENCTNVDNYFGETDSLLKKFRIDTVKIFLKTDSTRLMQVTTYKAGRKTWNEEYHSLGKRERTIYYSYGKDFVSAELIHYPSPENYNIYPSPRFNYLVEQLHYPGRRYLFRRDTATGIVRASIRHTWKKNGTILFEAFDTDKKRVASDTLKPVMSYADYQLNAKKSASNLVYANDAEEFRYNEKGKLIHYKSVLTRREDHYSYDERGLLTQIERFLLGKPAGTILYRYY